MPYSYLIETNGTHAFMMNGSTHQMEWSSTNASAVINSALADGNLTTGRTWQEKVVLMGNFTIDSSIIVYAYTILQIDARVTLASGANCHMIVNGHPSTYDEWVDICGSGVLDGNKDEQTEVVHGVFWNGTTAPPYRRTLRLYGLTIQRFRGDSIHLRPAPEEIGYVDHVHTQFSYGYGLRAECNDWFFSDSTFSSDKVFPIVGVASRITGSGCWISNCNFERGFELYWCYACQVSNCYADLGTSTFSNVRLRGAQYCTINNLLLRKLGNDGDTNDDAMTLETIETTRHSIHNTISNVIAGRFGQSATNIFSCAINETTTDQNYNTYLNINGYDTSNGIILRGANSSCNHSWNSTTWIS